ncbi:tRNA (uridine(54)-C5)-methyltransferase TrmA [Helicobacter sp. MIT 05-5293]|uniref:tRNA (uridine(54)-C5)-methyltransferase TrmA n=1 Tax=Helicobacter sp. MIT 05-5293 TaxID=1548149 RepID=UPI00051D62E2|nr:tRNA (uridine(54)-C5)-methyltransferase TrmA [Helicobacter sp. MIT 05-5293]TLD81013.1 tRNA (uridine(54)-C5)-methyltransferase TrmA [Helicobacter sp. MIT 05-5293]
MNCKHFGICGGCAYHALGYEGQFTQKQTLVREMFQNLIDPSYIEAFASPTQSFRARAEFRFDRHTPNTPLAFAMNRYGANDRTPIETCPILLDSLQSLMSLLLPSLRSPILTHKLYACNFLGSLRGESIITLIYHKQLDSQWIAAAQDLQSYLNSHFSHKIHIIGRSKNQKVILSSSTIQEELTLFAHTTNPQTYHYLKEESRFSQPNPFIIIKMLEFIKSHLPQQRNDLLELYSGSGNFSIALAKEFRSILATEVVKSAIKLLEENMSLNHITNITPIRLNAYESIQALNRQRTFFRLRTIDLDQFNLQCVLIDPPRSGVNDINILHFLATFSHIIYVSCNPTTLLKDMQVLSQSHFIKHFGVFDQFPYTHHQECVLILEHK